MPVQRSSLARTPAELAYLRALQVVLAIELVLGDGEIEQHDVDELRVLQRDATRLADRLERFVPPEAL